MEWSLRSALLCTVFLPALLFSQKSLTGKWEGAIQIAGQELTILVDFQNDSTATIDIPQQSAKGLKLTNVRFQDPVVHFELPAGPGLAVFDGRIKEDVVTGEFTQAGMKGTFELKRGEAIRVQSFDEAPIQFRPILGTWNGAINIMGQSLAILVHFKSVANELKATIDIPPQNAYGLNLKDVRYESPKIRFELPAGPGLAVFDGELKDESIVGSFTQAGMTGTFSLTRGQPLEEEKAVEEPPPYKEEEVTFSNDTLKFAGTLTIPSKPGHHPAVVMITGSGPQNRDEELFGFKPFKIIADHFTRNGIAVLRYDDRGVGGSGGSTMQSTTSDFADDVIAAVKYLQSRTDINPKQIGLCGHSEGGLVAPLASNRYEDIAYIILMSGPGVDGSQILLAQSELILRADSTSEPAIAEALELNKKIYAAIREGKDIGVYREEIRAALRKELDQMNPEQRKSITDADQYLKMRLEAQMRQVESPWFRFFVNYNPAPALTQVKCPILALFGELDLQVPAELNKEAMERALKNGSTKDYTFKVFPKTNHLFLSATTGSPREYVSLKKDFVQGFLETMSDWIAKRVTIVR
ncbi:MAG: alpha/beta hydrolase [Ignavibacteria bacterium]|nr:alpha/beta hydrolase [Ignavibacteria bacterium]